MHGQTNIKIREWIPCWYAR